MNRFLVLCFMVGCSLAAPYSFDVKSTSVKSDSASSTVAILKHIQQINDDGSYTFGYENADGSYRVENRDVNGYITGRYGYIDANGKLQETEYVAGKLTGRSVGYQARGGHIPVVSREQAKTFPIVRTVSSKQRALDYEYKSVDADEDGFPDDAPAIATKQTTYEPVVVRVVETTGKSDAYGSKTTTSKVGASNIEKVALVAPVKSGYSTSSAGAISGDAVITEVKVNEEKVEKVAETTPASVIRVVETKQYVEQPTVVRLVEEPIKKESHIYKVNESVFRVPAAKTYETVQQPETKVVEKVVEKKVTVGRLDSFLRELVKNNKNVKITYEQPKTSSYYSQQPTIVETTVVTDDDSVDIEAFGRII